MFVLAHFGGSQLASLGYLLDLVVAQTDYHVLRLEVSVNYLAHSMHVVEPDQALASKASDQRQRHSVVVVALNDLEEVNS